MQLISDSEWQRRGKNGATAAGYQSRLQNIYKHRKHTFSVVVLIVPKAAAAGTEKHCKPKRHYSEMQ